VTPLVTPLSVKLTLAQGVADLLNGAGFSVAQAGVPTGTVQMAAPVVVVPSGATLGDVAATGAAAVAAERLFGAD
jgi:hypothetical protein